VDVKTGKVLAVEALLRWQHPHLSLIAPAKLISLAEETGLIVPIGQWVVQTATTQAKAWQADGLPLLRMAINLSPLAPRPCDEMQGYYFSPPLSADKIAAILKAGSSRPYSWVQLIASWLFNAIIKRDPIMMPAERSGFISFKSTHAALISSELHHQNFFCDHRSDILRIGPAPYLSTRQLHHAMDIFVAVTKKIALQLTLIKELRNSTYMTTTNIINYIRGIPKVELHLHIEGSFEPELVFKIAQRNQLTVKIERPAPQNDAETAAIKKLSQKTLDIGAELIQADDGSIKVVFETAEQLSQAYDFDNLQEFLDIYYAGMSVLQSEQDFYDLTMAYLEKCHTQNVLRTEIFFDPQGHTCRGIPFERVINGISRALDDGKKQLGISSGLIMSYLRHLSEEDAINTWQEAQPHLDKFIAVGLDSAELGHPPSKFKNVFAMARTANKKVVCHAGEEGPPEYIWQALNLLEVDRIDHGNRSLEDNALVTRLVNDKMTLTICPLSNNKLQIVTEMSAHPLKMMLNHGLKVSVHSDDPAYFGGYINENFEAVQQALGLSRDDIYCLVLNAIDGSFIPEKQKPSLRAKVDAYHKAALAGENY